MSTEARGLVASGKVKPEAAAQMEETPDEVKRLHDAARSGNLEEVREAAKHVDDVNHPNGDSTALHVAAGVGI